MSKAPQGADEESIKQLLWIVAALVILYAVLDIIAQILPPHYSPISQPESDLAVGPYGYIMTANFVNRGILSLIFVYALTKALKLTEGDGSRSRGGVFLLGMWGVGALLLAIFPTDVPNVPVSWHGAIHLVVAILAFLGGAFGTLLFSLRFGQNKILRNARGFALPIAVIAVVSVFATLGSQSIATGVGGLLERIFIGSVLLWMLLVSVYLARRLGKEPDQSKTP